MLDLLNILRKVEPEVKIGGNMPLDIINDKEWS
jgi:hypothetical protein